MLMAVMADAFFADIILEYAEEGARKVHATLVHDFSAFECYAVYCLSVFIMSLYQVSFFQRLQRWIKRSLCDFCFLYFIQNLHQIVTMC